MLVDSIAIKQRHFSGAISMQWQLLLGKKHRAGKGARKSKAADAGDRLMEGKELPETLKDPLQKNL